MRKSPEESTVGQNSSWYTASEGLHPLCVVSHIGLSTDFNKLEIRLNNGVIDEMCVDIFGDGLPRLAHSSGMHINW